MHKKLIITLFLCAISCVRAMDVDTESSKKRTFSEAQASDTSASSTTATHHIPSNASLVLSDIFVLSDEQKKRCEWAIKQKLVENAQLETSVHLTYMVDKLPIHPNNDGTMSKRAYIVTKNRKKFAQNDSHRIANDLILKLSGTMKSELSGPEKAQAEAFKQITDACAHMSQINDQLYHDYCAQEPPQKKQKH